jgi:hypothetical protein
MYIHGSRIEREVEIYAANLANRTKCIEHRHNFREGLREKSKLAQHAFEDGHGVGWDEARILEIGSNSR